MTSVKFVDRENAAKSRTSMPKKKFKQIPEYLMFNSATLKATVESRLKEVESRGGGWQGAFGIFISLAATYFVSDFKDKFGFSAAQWQSACFVLMITTFIWTIVAIARLIFRPSMGDFLDSLYNISLTKESRRVIFLFKAKDVAGVTKVLAYHDPVWGCYLLPNVRRSEVPRDDAKLENILENRFGGGQGCFTATNLSEAELVSNKISQRSGKYTMYSFDFFFVKICPKLQDKFASTSFKIGSGFSYHWLSLEELFADPSTAARNRDVLDFIAENDSTMLGANVPSSIASPLRA